VESYLVELGSSIDVGIKGENRRGLRREESACRSEHPEALATGDTAAHLAIIWSCLAARSSKVPWVSVIALANSPLRVSRALDVVDPTGAGDAFCAGIMFKLAREPFRSILGRKNQLSNLALNHWKEILTYASACGAACCTALGTTTAVKPPIIHEMMREQSERFTSKIAIL